MNAFEPQDLSLDGQVMHMNTSIVKEAVVDTRICNRVDRLDLHQSRLSDLHDRECVLGDIEHLTRLSEQPRPGDEGNQKRWSADLSTDQKGGRRKTYWGK